MNKLSNTDNKYIFEKDNNNNMRKIIIQTYEKNNWWIKFFILN